MQGARNWNEKLNNIMVKELGFQRLAVDHCVYTRTTVDGVSILAVHIDDICATASTTQEMSRLKADLACFFDLVDLGEVKWLLGIGITRDRKKRAISLSQHAYIDQITARFNLQNSHPVHTPIDVDTLLCKAMCPQTATGRNAMKKVPYLNAIGSIMYAAIGTRPDVAFAVQFLGQYNSNPGPAHWTAAKRVIQYLNTTKDYVLTLGGPELRLKGWCDSDWGSNPDDRRSISAYVFSLGHGAISWNSKKQATVATSSTEAEYIASCHATKEAVWLRALLKLIGFPQSSASTILCDNQGSNALTEDPGFHARTKHIDIQYHYVREKVADQEVIFDYVPSEENPADALTKRLARPAFSYLVGLINIHPNKTATLMPT